MDGTKLPNSHGAIVDIGKITECLLSTASSKGRSKARFFLGFGFNAENWQAFAKALRLHGTSHDVASMVDTAYGLRYRVDGIIETPDGRNPHIRTVWQIDTGTDNPRLIASRPIRPSRSQNDVSGT